MLDRVVVERRDDQLLVAIDLAAGQGDAVLGLVNQELGEWVGVGENFSRVSRKNSDIWNVVVPPLMMTTSPSTHISTALRAIARLASMLIGG